MFDDSIQHIVYVYTHINPYTHIEQRTEEGTNMTSRDTPNKMSQSSQGHGEVRARRDGAAMAMAIAIYGQQLHYGSTELHYGTIGKYREPPNNPANNPANNQLTPS